jgi:hypothetical protein
MDALVQHRKPTAKGGTEPMVWQRTDTVGTEIVFRHDGATPSADGSAVVAGPLPYVSQWHAELDPDDSVRVLTVSCHGDDWRRALRLERTPERWICRTEETGDPGAASGRLGMPPPGIEDPDRLDPNAAVRLTDAPIFMTWALRRLALSPGDPAREVPTVRVLRPSLAVLPARATYQLVGERRLRITGDEPGSVYDLDPDGRVRYRAGRLRLLH